MLKEVCSDVAIEPPLIELTGENFKLKSTKTGDESRTDIYARGFWIKGQQEFFDVRVFDATFTNQCSNVISKTKMKRNDITISVFIIWRYE